MFRVVQNIANHLSAVSGCLILVMLAIVLYEVWTRFVVGHSVAWASEVPEHVYLIIVFLGMAYTTRVAGHVSMDVVVERISRRARALLGIITSFIAGGVSGFLTWQLAVTTKQAFVERWTTAALIGVIEWPFYLIATLGCFLMVPEWIGKIVANWRELKKPA